MRINKIVLSVFCMLLISIGISSVEDSERYPGGTEENLQILLVLSSSRSTTGDTISSWVGIRNLGNYEIEYVGILPIDERYVSLEYKFLFFGTLAECIKNDYYKIKPHTGIRASVATCIAPGSTRWVSVPISDYYNIEEMNESGIIEIEGEYLLWEDKPTGIGTSDCYPIGSKPSNRVRIQFNMETEIVNSSILVEPHKWNTAWEKEQSDAGVFTAFLGNIEGYSAEDIMQDTVLFNGTLKPIEIKIVDGHKDMEGKVLMMKFSKKEGMDYLGIKEVGDMKKINISGQLNDEKWFYAETEVEITGKKEKESKE